MTETAEQQDLLATLADLPDSAVERIMAHAAETDRDLQFAFEQFHQANPGVYKLLVQLAYEAKEHGHAKFGIATLYERARWEFLMGATSTTDSFKLNNSFRAFYSRLIMEQEADLEGFFETRRGRWND